jgi:hypothetical protein
MTAEEELILDVSMSFVTGLEGIRFPGGGAMSEKQRVALRNFLDLLNIALPPEWGIHRLIDGLRSRLIVISKGRAFLQQEIDRHPLPRKTWSPSCAKKEGGLTGHSCGMWKLLHVITVGVAEHRGGISLIESGMLGETALVFSPIAAADAIRDYIEEFFNCAVCKKNFIETYDNCDNNRRCDRLTEDTEEASIADWKELPLWLWEVHNEVSVRIVQEEKTRSMARLEISGRPRKSPKPLIAVVWPNIETCFLCFHDDGTWDEGEVFAYLESTYWPDSELDPKSERLIRYHSDDSQGLGLFLWVFMFMVLWIVYKGIATSSPAQLVYRAKRMVRPTKLRSN